MSDEVALFGFENDDIKAGWDKYSGKKGEVHRCGIIFSDPKAMFAGVKCHFHTKYFQCRGGICCEKLGPPKWRVGAVLVKYATDKLGNPKQPFAYEILPWMFGPQTWMKVRNLNAEFALTTHDVKIACTNEDFQNLDITPCQESIWQMKDELKTKIMNEAKPAWDYVKKGLASNLSAEEIKDLLNMSSGSAVDPTSKLDLDKVLSQI